MLTRREFIIGGAAVAVAATAGGSGGLALWDAGTRPEGPAAAWAATRGVDRLLLAGTLAASSHNTQPLRFRLTGDGIDLLGDPARTMGRADARLRELHVSLGCAIESVAIAASEAGTPVSVEMVPGAPAAHFARLRFGGGAAAEHADLAPAIPLRRTNRGPYDVARPVAPGELDALGAFAGAGVRVVWLTSPSQRTAFTDLTVEATTAHVADAAIQHDSHLWYRMPRSEAKRMRDGITVSSANLGGPVSLLLGVFPPTPESFDQGWATATRDTHCATASAFGLLVVERAGDHRAWVDAGRAYARMQLAATLAGLATHPLSQALALRDRDVVAGATGRFFSGLEQLGGPGEVVLAFRVGRPERIQPPSLRRPPTVRRA